MTLDILVLALYALGMLVLGWFGMRRSRNQEDYLVAGPNGREGVVSMNSTVHTLTLIGDQVDQRRIAPLVLIPISMIDPLWVSNLAQEMHSASSVDG